MALIASTYQAGANMGGILGDSWNWVKKNPLVLIPPAYVAVKSFEYAAPIVKGAVSQAQQGAQQTAAAFRPAPAPSSVDQLTSALTLGGSTTPGASSSSMLPIVLGAGAAGLLLLLAFGRRKKT